MGKAERTRTQNARERIVAQQASARRAETRRKALIAASSVAAVAALVLAVIVVKLVQSPPAASAAAADSAVATEITTIPAATFNAVGRGTATGLRRISGQPELILNGKPELLYIGGEFCPYRAAERWAIAAAVSRLGTLSGLRFIRSSPADAYPDMPTLSFYRSRYASKYLSFVPVEWYGEKADSSTPLQHVYLQHPTQQQSVLFSRYSGGAIPFLDIGNQYLLPDTQYYPSALADLSWAQVAAAMRNPASTVGKDIDGAANMITAAICTVTRGQPGSVCRSAGVAAASG